MKIIKHDKIRLDVKGGGTAVVRRPRDFSAWLRSRCPFAWPKPEEDYPEGYITSHDDYKAEIIPGDVIDFEHLDYLPLETVLFDDTGKIFTLVKNTDGVRLVGIRVSSTGEVSSDVYHTKPVAFGDTTGAIAYAPFVVVTIGRFSF